MNPTVALRVLCSDPSNDLAQTGVNGFEDPVSSRYIIPAGNRLPVGAVSMKTLPRGVRIVPLLVGLIILVVLLYKVGIRDVVGNFAIIGWGLLPVLALSVLWKGVNTYAWVLAFPPDLERPDFLTLYRVAMAGDSINNLLPTGNVGGELAKPYLLRPHIRMAESLPAILANKTMELLSGVIFIGLGVGLALFTLPLPSRLRLAIGSAVVVGGLLVGLFSYLQRKHSLSRLLTFLDRIGFEKFRLKAKADPVKRIDERLSAFYHHYPWRFLGCLSLRFLSRALGVLETWLILDLMGAEPTLATAVLFVSLPLILTTALFFVPGGVGLSEAGHTYLASLFSLGSVAGLSLALVKRCRQLFWTVVGSLLLVPLQLRASQYVPNIVPDTGSDPVPAATD